MSECLSCNQYDNENHYCPTFCKVINETLEDAKKEAVKQYRHNVLCSLQAIIYEGDFDTLMEYFDQLEAEDEADE